MKFEDSWIKKMMTNKSKNQFNEHNNIFGFFQKKNRTDGGNGFLNKAFQKKGKQKMKMTQCLGNRIVIDRNQSSI